MYRLFTQPVFFCKCDTAVEFYQKSVMSNELVTSLVTLIGVIVSVVVSLFISARQTANELTKLRAEIQQSYADRLLEKRLDVYPKTYEALSDFSKKLELGAVGRIDFQELRDRVAQLDSVSAILFSAHTGNIAFFFRQFMNKALASDEPLFNDPTMLAEVKKIISEFELSLKSDLGVYVVDFADPEKRFVDYDELYAAVKKGKNTTSGQR